MALSGGEAITELCVGHVFIGSRIDAGIEKLRAAAAVVGERKVAPVVRVMVLPGSYPMKLQAE